MGSKNRKKRSVMCYPKDDLANNPKFSQAWRVGTACSVDGLWKIKECYQFKNTKKMWEILNWTVCSPNIIGGLKTPFDVQKKGGGEIWVFRKGSIPNKEQIEKQYPHAKECLVLVGGDVEYKSLQLVCWMVGGQSQQASNVLGVRIKGGGDLRIWVKEYNPRRDNFLLKKEMSLLYNEEIKKNKGSKGIYVNF